MFELFIGIFALLDDGRSFLTSAATANQLTDPPVTIKLLERGEDKGKYHILNVVMQNRNTKAVWCVFPNYTNPSLSKNGVFRNNNWNDIPIDATQYRSDEGTATEVKYFGKEGLEHFFYPLIAALSLMVMN